MHQIPLVLFTVCIQAATGLLLFMGAKKLCTAQALPVGTKAPRDFSLVPMWALFVFSLCASLYHLGKPLNALYVVQGIFHGSPLSMEIVAMCVFGGLTLLYSLLAKNAPATLWQNTVLALAMLAALALSYCVANVYTIATVPLWDSAWTFVQFFLSVLALGSVGMLCIASIQADLSTRARNVWYVVAISIVLALTIATVGYTAWSGLMLGREGVDSYALLPMLRIALQTAGLTLLMLARGTSGSQALWRCAGAMLCILGSELAGRIMFYDFQQSSGMLQMLAY